MNHKDHTNEAVELLKKLIATPSVSRDESAAADILEKYLTEKSCISNQSPLFKVHRQGNNIWCIPSNYNTFKPTILLNAHIDTVKPVAGWQHDPFTPTLEEDDTVYGLGSNDCGGGLMALLQTFLILNGVSPDSSGTPINPQSSTLNHQPSILNPHPSTISPQSYNLIYLASAEEEVSGKNGIESVLPLLPHIDFAIVGEPTGLQPAIAEKGLMVIDATAHGKAGHAARNEGDNAIYHAIEDIKWISEWQFPKQTDLLGPVKNTVTIVNAGTQHNVIPDQCTFTIDVRSNECYTNEEIFAFFQENLSSELKARSFRLSSSRIDINHPFVQRCIKKGLVPFGSPTLSDQALMRFPSLKLGPGESSRSHTADEFIKISEIESAISLYLELLDGLKI